MFGITDFQVTLHMVDGSTKTSFDRNDNWTSIAGVEVSLTAEESFRGAPMSRTQSSRFFIRNILSN